jgi:hypothetical protein
MSPQKRLERDLRRLAPRACTVHPPYGDSVRVTGSAGDLVRLLKIARAAGLVPIAVRYDDEGQPYARFRA